MDIETFSECLKITQQTKGANHLIIGNGFSIGLFPEIFNYKVLAKKIKSEVVKKLFESLGTNDFEYVLRMLNTTLLVITHYSNSEMIAQKITESLEKIKQTLIDVIGEAHPSNPSAISDDQYNSCFKFLSNFESGKKYTFNYDLILYWVYMHFMEEIEGKKLKCDDGFRKDINHQEVVTWEIGREIKQSLYYLHGAMHIFMDGSQLEKYTWINSRKTICEQVTESLAASKYPVFITEGSKEHKMERIKNNVYLGRSFASLKSIGGNLFIYGHSLRDEDDHVFDFINQHNTALKNMFIGIFGDKNSNENKKIIDKVESWARKFQKNYILFRSESANVWGNA